VTIGFLSQKIKKDFFNRLKEIITGIYSTGAKLKLPILLRRNIQIQFSCLGFCLQPVALLLKICSKFKAL
jgi:hypothetical protein